MSEYDRQMEQIREQQAYERFVEQQEEEKYYQQLREERPNPMSEERKVICPQGHEMAVRARRIMASSTWQAICYCHCGWQGPVGIGESQEDAIKAAYLAATSRPPNLPMTREQAIALPDDTTLWVYRRGYDVMKRNVGQVRDLLTHAPEIIAGWTIFTADPTTADIEAARAGKEADHE
jgi:hypothetical protein